MHKRENSYNVASETHYLCSRSPQGCAWTGLSPNWLSVPTLGNASGCFKAVLGVWEPQDKDEFLGLAIKM